MPGIGEDHEPDHSGHQGVVHDDEDDDTGQGLAGAAKMWNVTLLPGCSTLTPGPSLLKRGGFPGVQDTGQI